MLLAYFATGLAVVPCSFELKGRNMKQLFAAALVAGGMLAASVATAGAATISFSASPGISYNRALTFNSAAQITQVLNGDEFADQGVLFGSNWYLNGGGGTGQLLPVDSQVQPGSLYFTSAVTAAVVKWNSTPGGTTFSAYLNGNLVEQLYAFTNSEWFFHGFTGILFDEIRFFRADGDSDPSFYGSIDELYFQVAPVPLPAGAWLLLSALGGLGFFGWRRKRLAAA